jgi:hypothetical protein
MLNEIASTLLDLTTYPYLSRINLHTFYQGQDVAKET